MNNRTFAPLLDEAVLHRCMELDLVLQSKRLVRVKHVARLLEVSEKTIKRDLVYLRNTLGAPLVYFSDVGAYGYRGLWRSPPPELRPPPSCRAAGDGDVSGSGEEEVAA